MKLTNVFSLLAQKLKHAVVAEMPPEIDDVWNYGKLADSVARQTGKHPAFVKGVIAEYGRDLEPETSRLTLFADVVKIYADLVKYYAQNLGDADANALARRHEVRFKQDGPAPEAA